MEKRQINNGFLPCYYLFENGQVINMESGQIMAESKKRTVQLLDTAGKRKKISLKRLYRLVFEKPFCIDDIENLQGEEWKIIDNSNGEYMISNYGRIKSFQRYKAEILKPSLQKGYERVELQLDYGRRAFFVHRLVAEAYLETPQSLDMQIHHIDFNKRNNAAANLQWLPKNQHSIIHAKHRKEGK